MEGSQYPTLEEFLKASMEDIRKIAPATVIFNAGGTRRAAALAHKNDKEYAEYSFLKMIENFDLFDQHGICHLFHTFLTEGNYKEKTKNYRENIEYWIKEWLMNKRALDIYAKSNWRMRLVGEESWPGLSGVDEQLRNATQSHTGLTLWITVASHPETRWQQLFQLCSHTKINSREEAIRALFREDIPLANLFIGFVKPTLYSSIAHPLIIGHLNCYWRTRPGYSLNQEELRTILYDHLYLRTPRHIDNTNAAKEIMKYRSAWESPSILGRGVKLGPYWYPAPFLITDNNDDNQSNNI